MQPLVNPVYAKYVETYNELFTKYGPTDLWPSSAHDHLMKEFWPCREADKLLDQPSKGNRVPWYFVTFTLDAQHSNQPWGDCIKKIKSLASSTVVPVSAYYGCQEHTKAGVPHYHVLFHVPLAGKKGFGSSHISNFWKYGHVDIKKPNGDLSTSLLNLISYIEKEEGLKRYFGDKNALQTFLPLTSSLSSDLSLSSSNDQTELCFDGCESP